MNKKRLPNLGERIIMSIIVSMISIIEVDGHKRVCSLDVYKNAGYLPKHYSRWVKTQLTNVAQKDVDYFDIIDPDHQERFYPKSWNKRHQRLWEKPGLYFLTMETAILVCAMAKTVKSKKLRVFLQQNK
jgi:hypothetical protein